MNKFSLKQYRFDWKLSLLVLILLPLLLRLGFWQLEREQEKQELQTHYIERQQEAPLALAEINLRVDLQYQQVWLEGSYDNEHIFLLDNKIYQGKVGYEVVQPFKDISGQVVLVNRGWIEQGMSRADIPTPPLVASELRLSGSIYVPLGEQITLGDTQPDNTWPKVIQELEPALLASLADIRPPSKLFPYSVRLSEFVPSVLSRSWSVISTSPEKHRGYAVQWFLMATALLCLYLYYSFSAQVAVKTVDESKQ